MKREAFAHPKMKRLCRRLSVPLWQGVGILESVWNLAARHAPRGDIGRLSDLDIAIGIEYQSDEVALIEALIDSRWIDPHPELRLVIHDWPEHADPYVHARIAKAAELFYNGTPPRLPHELFNGDTRHRIKAEYRNKYGIEISDKEGSRNQPHVKAPEPNISNLFNEDRNLNENSSSPGLVRDESPKVRDESPKVPDLSGTNRQKSRTCPEQVRTSPLPLPLPLQPEYSAVTETLPKTEQIDDAQHQSINIAFCSVVGRAMRQIDVDLLGKLRQSHTEQQIEAGIYIGGIRARGLGKKPKSLAYFADEIGKAESAEIKNLTQYIAYLKRKLANTPQNGAHA